MRHILPFLAGLTLVGCGLTKKASTLDANYAFALSEDQAKRVSKDAVYGHFSPERVSVAGQTGYSGYERFLTDTYTVTVLASPVPGGYAFTATGYGTLWAGPKIFASVWSDALRLAEANGKRVPAR